MIPRNCHLTTKLYIYCLNCTFCIYTWNNKNTVFFSPTAKLAMGSLAQNSSGAIRCSCITPGSGQGSGGFRRWGSKGFRCRWLMRFRGVSGQIADEVPEGSGADSRQGSAGLRGRKLMKFQRVPVRCRWLMRFRKVPGQMADEVPESSGADSQKLSKIFQAVGVNAWVYFFMEYLCLKSALLYIPLVTRYIYQQTTWPSDTLKHIMHGLYMFCSNQKK